MYRSGELDTENFSWMISQNVAICNIHVVFEGIHIFITYS